MTISDGVVTLGYICFIRSSTLDLSFVDLTVTRTVIMMNEVCSICRTWITSHVACAQHVYSSVLELVTISVIEFQFPVVLLFHS